ncbi:Serine protease 56, partial [Coemansia spiralis]
VAMSDVTGFQGTILLINGRQSSCESVLVDSQAGFVAASCLSGARNGTFEGPPVYEIITKQSSDMPTMRYRIEKVTTHPKYNPSTYVNNLAVIQFNSAGSANWLNYIGINPGEWSDNYFIRRTLSSVSQMQWNNIVGFSSTETPSYCEQASRAYSANKGDFLCNYAGVLSITNHQCKVPYGTVFAPIQPSDLTTVAIHSHSAVYGDTMCSSARKLHYYTVLRNYIGWAASVLGRPVGGFAKDGNFKFTPQRDYSMKSVSTDPISGVQMFSGN